MQIKNKFIKPITLAALIFGSATMAFTGGCGITENPIGATTEIWGQADATETDMISKIPGYIDVMYVKEGQRVSKGEILAHVDSKQLLAKQSEVEAQVAAARAQAAQAKAGMELAKLDLDRVTTLYNADAVSRQMYDGAKTKYDVSVESYQQALSGVKAYEEGVQQVVVNIEDTYIKSPIDGIITSKYVNQGALVSTGMPIYGVQNPNDNWVNFKVPETILDQFHVGQELKLEGRNKNLHVTGTIVDISQKPDFATKRATSERGNATDIISYNVKVQINDPKIFPGMRFKMVDYSLPQGDNV